jgi:hypothetical protein
MRISTPNQFALNVPLLNLGWCAALIDIALEHPV